MGKRSREKTRLFGPGAGNPHQDNSYVRHARENGVLVIEGEPVSTPFPTPLLTAEKVVEKAAHAVASERRRRTGIRTGTLVEQISEGSEEKAPEQNGVNASGSFLPL